MKYKKLDPVLNGAVLVLIINGAILFVLNFYTAKVLKYNRFSYETEELKFWLPELSHIRSFFGWYQYIYIIPVTIWQALKRRLWLSLGIIGGSTFTLLISLIKL